MKESISWLASNAAYNYYDNQANQCARAYYIFIKNKIDSIRIDTLFDEKYGISLEWSLLF